MIKNKSKIIKIIFLTITLIINTKICFAANFVASGGSGGQSNSSNSMSKGTGTIQDGLKEIVYEYEYSVGGNKGVNINAYDMNGESVIPHDIIIDENKYKFKAGTWIGINVVETQSSFWRLNVDKFTIKEIVKKYECYYERDVLNSCTVIKNGNACIIPDCDTSCTTSDCSCSCKGGGDACGYHKEYKREPFKAEYYADFKCPSLDGWGEGKVTGNTEEEKSYDGDKVAEIINTTIASIQASAESMVGGATGKIRYIKLNSYPLDQETCKKSPDKCYETISGESKGVQNGPTDNRTYGSYYVDIEYLQEKVCINVKNSDVTYGRECKEDEIRIKNAEVYDEYLNATIKYWHYFIPLNAKSTDNFWIEAVNNDNSYFSIDECVSAIENLSKNNQTYKGYILPLVGDDTFFVGDYLSYANPERSEDYKLLQSGGGCKLSAKVRIPVTQEFYNETTNKEGIKRFKGFNFYYKPININNPFPNGLSTTSLWKEWYDTVKSGKIATPDISKSFNEVTYIATNINAAKVRNYTKNNPYTSWKNISLGGRSSFIENENIVTRNEGVSFYKLGCGPYNSDWSECKK